MLNDAPGNIVFLRCLLILLTSVFTISCTDQSKEVSSNENAFILAKNTQFLITLNSDLSSNTHKEGDLFDTKLKEPFKLDGQTILKKGTIIKSQIKSAKRYQKFGDKANLALSFDRVILGDGTEVPLSARLDSRSGRPTIVVDGKAIEETNILVNTAIMGALLEDASEPSNVQNMSDEGLFLGAMIGTAAVLISDAREVRLPAGTEILISLNEELAIPRPPLDK